MKFVGNTIGMFGLYIVYTFTIQQSHRYGSILHWDRAFLGLLVGVLFLGLGMFISYQRIKADQYERTKESMRILNNVLEGRNDRNFALYLRPFELDGKITVNQIDRGLFSFENLDRPGVDPIERLLADALIKTYPTVALGVPVSEISGVGHVGLLTKWQNAVVLLLHSAKLIVIVPSNNNSTLWEIKQVVQFGYLSKTVFLMPSKRRIYNYDRDCYIEEIWESARIAVKDKVCLDFPKYNASGAVFRFREADQSTIFHELNSWPTPRSFAKVVNKLLD